MIDGSFPISYHIFYGMWGNGWSYWQIEEFQRNIADEENQ